MFVDVCGVSVAVGYDLLNASVLRHQRSGLNAAFCLSSPSLFGRNCSLIARNY